MSTTTSVQVEMMWRCPDNMCDHVNLGRSKECTRCGRPKGPDVQDFFPDGDGTSLSTVTEPALNTQATAGRDRVCRYCNTAQKRSGSNCERCRASLSESTKDAQPEIRPDPVDEPEPASDPRWQSPHRTGIPAHWTIFGVLAAIAAVLMLAWCALGTHDVPVTVTSVTWIHSIKVERRVVAHGSGFRESEPIGAFNEVERGSRWHHDEQVVDHYEPVDHPYTEQVVDHYDRVDHPHDDRVPDGTELYSCTKKVRGPDACRKQNCKPNKNGFATCDNVCNPTYTTAPDTCTRTRYKTVTVHDWRQEPVYRTEQRHRFTQEPVMRTVHHNAMWYEWDAWVWVHAPERDAAESGLSTADLRDPNPTLGPDERALPIMRSYDVTVSDVEGKSSTFHPTSSAEFMRYPLASKHVMRVDGLGGVVMDPPSRGK